MDKRQDLDERHELGIRGRDRDDIRDKGEWQLGIWERMIGRERDEKKRQV